jgi:hypothetical protein
VGSQELKSALARVVETATVPVFLTRAEAAV